MRYCFSDYTLDLPRFELRRNGDTIPLRRKAFDLIVYLLTRRDRVVSRQELLGALWPDQIVSDGVLDSCLVTARRALGDSGRRQRVIKTQHGRGYRFIVSVTTPLPSNGSALPEDTLPFPTPDADAVAIGDL